jgi:hypothetical protein
MLILGKGWGGEGGRVMAAGYGWNGWDLTRCGWGRSHPRNVGDLDHVGRSCKDGGCDGGHGPPAGQL